MNLEESNSFVEKMERNNKNKKNVLGVLVVCAILVVVLLVMIAYLKYKDSQVLKMFVDNKQVGITPTLMIEHEGNNYMNVRELAEMLGYSYKKGEYKSYTEDPNSCNFSNAYEIVSLSADAESYTKYIINDRFGTGAEIETETNSQLIVTDEVTGEQSINIVVASEDETQETFSIAEPIKLINNELYVAFEEIPRIFSAQMSVSKNRIIINSIYGLVGSAVQTATSLGYAETSNIYENLTAMIDGMLVVGDGTNYGVVSLVDGKEVLSLKYEKVVYMQNAQEFLVTAEGSVGIVSKDGKTIIKPTEYDKISNLDELNKLYLVEKNNKFGVVNRQGETIVYAEYDAIGIQNSEEFDRENIRNFSLLFDECIPVKSGSKFGIIDIEGNEKLKCTYDGLGYIANDTTVDEENNNEDSQDEDDTDKENIEENKPTVIDEHDSVLTIPESTGIKGIVVNLNGLYGIYDAQAKRLIVPCACTKIYSKTKAGVTTYYMEYNEQQLELESYLEGNNLKSVSTENQVEENSTEEFEEQENNEE